MPVSSITDGRDQIYTAFKTVWGASAYSAVPIFYPDSKHTPPPNTSWVRITVTHTSNRQATLGNVDGIRRYRVYGIVTIQIFTPFGDGQALADLMAEVAKRAFQGVVTGADAVSFRNARIMDGRQDGQWWQTNVMTEFDYDEVH
jgi:hypothetical protein